MECIHCKKVKTKREFEGNPSCPECRMNILCSREPLRYCPVDGSQLIKAYNEHEVIIDRCKVCNGIWLDANELDAIKEVSHHSSGNLVTGVIIGSMLN